MSIYIIDIIIWLILSIIDFIILAYDQWKTEKTKMTKDEILIQGICCLIFGPILFGLIIYLYIKKWRNKNEEDNSKNKTLL